MNRTIRTRFFFPPLAATVLLLSGALQASEVPERAQVAFVAGAPVSLSPEAAEQLRQRALLQCGLSADSRAELPWYFHFQFGRSLLSEGDPRRAIAELTRSTTMKPTPAPSARLYGMWYENYLPYLALSQAHASLKNWRCAADALALSQAYGEYRIAGFDQKEFDRLLHDVKAHESLPPHDCKEHSAE